MKHTQYILPALVLGGLLYVYAGNADERIKPSHLTPPPAEQNALPPAPLRLSGAEDGIPYGLSLKGTDNKEKSPRGNNPEPNNVNIRDF